MQVLYEFCTIRKWKEEERAIETFITKVDAMIKVLGQHFGIEQNELGKAKIILRLYESVTNKRFRKNTPLFLVKEVCIFRSIITNIEITFFRKFIFSFFTRLCLPRKI